MVIIDSKEKQRSSKMSAGKKHYWELLMQRHNLCIRHHSAGNLGDLGGSIPGDKFQVLVVVIDVDTGLG